MNLANVPITECEMSVRTTNLLTQYYGYEVTLATIAAVTDDELRAIPHFTHKCLREIREVISMTAAVPEPRHTKYVDCDAALAISEEAFRAGFQAGLELAGDISCATAAAEEIAWSNYEPSELVKDMIRG